MVTPSKPPPPCEKLLPLPTPCFKMFLERSLNDPLTPHHPTSSTFHCYPPPHPPPLPPLKILIMHFTARHKVVHNGGSQNFEGSLFNKKTTYVAQILQSLSYKICSVILPKFNKFGLFILILDISAIMDQAACCYSMTTSEIGL